MKKVKPTGGELAAYKVRELEASDFGDGFLETLGNLSDTGGLTPIAARNILAAIQGQRYHVLVAVADGRVIGATTLLVEQKFIHGGGLVGHIEDVAVRKGYEGRGVGGSLVRAAIAMARGLGCYKCILDCKEELVGFYERLGFSRHDVGMRIDLKRDSRRNAEAGRPRSRGSIRSSGTGT